MLLLQLITGQSIRVDISRDDHVQMIDDRVLQERIKRIAIINDKGTRIDLPVNSRGRYFIWVERVKDGSDIRGEKVCMRNDKILFRVIHYYSDGRFVTDIDIDGGFR